MSDRDQRHLPFFPVEPVSLTLAAFEALAVRPFPNSWARQNIWTGFQAFIGGLSEAGLKWHLYIDGSFLTNKPDPSDIDFLLVAKRPDDGYHAAQKAFINELSRNRDHLIREYRSDFRLLVETSDLDRNMVEIEQVLNVFTINEYGPPKRAALLVLPEGL